MFLLDALKIGIYDKLNVDVPHSTTVQKYKHNGPSRMCGGVAIVCVCDVREHQCQTDLAKKTIYLRMDFFHSFKLIMSDCVADPHAHACALNHSNRSECLQWFFASKTFLWDYLCSVKSCRHCYLLLVRICGRIFRCRDCATATMKMRSDGPMRKRESEAKMRKVEEMAKTIQK